MKHDRRVQHRRQPCPAHPAPSGHHRQLGVPRPLPAHVRHAVGVHRAGVQPPIRRRAHPVHSHRRARGSRQHVLLLHHHVHAAGRQQLRAPGSRAHAMGLETRAPRVLPVGAVRAVRPGHTVLPAALAVALVRGGHHRAAGQRVAAALPEGGRREGRGGRLPEHTVRGDQVGENARRHEPPGHGDQVPHEPQLGHRADRVRGAQPRQRRVPAQANGQVLGRPVLLVRASRVRRRRRPVRPGVPQDDQMRLPQVRSVRHHTDARRHVRDGSEHHQREDLRRAVVLVFRRAAADQRHRHCLARRPVHAVLPGVVQPDAAPRGVPWRPARSRRPGRYRPADHVLGLAVHVLPVRQHGRIRFPRLAAQFRHRTPQGTRFAGQRR